MTNPNNHHQMGNMNMNNMQGRDFGRVYDMRRFLLILK